MARMIALVAAGTKRTQRPLSTQRNQGPLRTLRSLRSILLAAAILWLAAAPVAHDLERTQVLITFERDGSFVLDVANDPSWLKLRLERFPGSFADRVVLWVDGHEVRPTSVEFIPGPMLATHRLRGRMPTNAQTLRWYYGLVIDPYPLAVRRADGRVAIEEIVGDAWSRTIDVSGQFRAPILSSTMAGIVLMALLAVPIALRIGSARTKDTKETEATKEVPRADPQFNDGRHRPDDHAGSADCVADRIGAHKGHRGNKGHKGHKGHKGAEVNG